MSRPAKNRNIMRNMCARLSAVIDSTNYSDSQISRLLGYANPATITRMRRGETFIDSERLALLVEIEKQFTPNLHWILTGLGDPVISAKDTAHATALNQIIQRTASISPLCIISIEDENIILNKSK